MGRLKKQIMLILKNLSKNQLLDVFEEESDDEEEKEKKWKYWRYIKEEIDYDGNDIIPDDDIDE